MQRHLIAAWRLVRWYGPQALLMRMVQYVRHQRLIAQDHRSLPRAQKQVSDHQIRRVLYVYGSLERWSATTRYRALNMCEHLRARGIDAEAVGDNTMLGRLEWMLSFDVIVIVRLPLYPALSNLIQAAQQRGISVVYDIDDFIWDAALLERMDWPAEDKLHYQRHHLLYRQAMEACDSVVVPTEYLAAEVTKLGRPVAIVPNGLSRAQVDLSTEAMRRRRHSDSVKIGYFSGTATHRRDFEQAAPAIRRLLGEFPHVRLLVGGYVSLPPQLAGLKGRISHLPWVRWERLPRQLALADVNIAPLEVGNPFCESKSELKYFEAGLVAIPTVASATDTYRRAITHAENGCLAVTQQEWYEALRLLVQSPEVRQQVGHEAREHVLRTYTEAPIGDTALNVLQGEMTKSAEQELPRAVTA